MAPLVIIRFSRCATPTLRERWQWKSPFDTSLWICRLTHSPFSHVDVVMPDGNLLGASDAPYAPVVYGNPRGVAVRPPDYQRFAVRRDVSIVTTDERRKRFYKFCTEQIGKPFDSEALKPSIFLSPQFTERNWRANGKWWCAELVTCAVEYAPLLDWTIPGIKNRVTAADLILLLAPLYDFDKAAAPIPGIERGPQEL